MIRGPDPMADQGKHLIVDCPVDGASSGECCGLRFDQGRLMKVISFLSITTDRNIFNEPSFQQRPLLPVSGLRCNGLAMTAP